MGAHTVFLFCAYTWQASAPQAMMGARQLPLWGWLLAWHKSTLLESPMVGGGGVWVACVFGVTTPLHGVGSDSDALSPTTPTALICDL
jgi:hypothetical protein